MSGTSGLDPIVRGWLLAGGTSHRPQLTPEQQAALQKKHHDEDPRHIKALARRRKRKRGGPK